LNDVDDDEDEGGRKRRDEMAAAAGKIIGGIAGRGERLSETKCLPLLTLALAVSQLTSVYLPISLNRATDKPSTHGKTTYEEQQRDRQTHHATGSSVAVGRIINGVTLSPGHFHCQQQPLASLQI